MIKHLAGGVWSWQESRWKMGFRTVAVDASIYLVAVKRQLFEIV